MIKGEAWLDTALMQEVASESQNQHVALADKKTALLLYDLASRENINNILEIGTGLGYATLTMAAAQKSKGSGRITSIELVCGRYHRACEYVYRAGFGDFVELLFGDAKKLIKELSGPWDLLFFDAAMGQYGFFADTLLPYLNPKGYLVADNINFYKPETGQTILRRHRTMEKRLKEFKASLLTKPGLKLAEYAFGEGLLVIEKKEEKND